MRKHEERFSAEKYFQRRERAEAYHRFLKNPQAKRIQEHFHNITMLGEDKMPLTIIIAE
ncbi:hypothetical protein JW968_01275 [Candidatus Woesearchaeota archaeon]|nr:hypothetical protein [Candidatus Woesearchaeota archaeon]